MRIIILSDSHDNIVRLKHVIGFAKECKAGAIIHCGDWNTPLAVKQFESDLIGFEGVKIPVFGVLGNADIDPEMKVKSKKLKVKINEDFLEITLNGKRIGICHYPPSPAASEGRALQHALESGKYDLLVHGHTHKRGMWHKGTTLLVNPGALQKTLEPSFAVYDTETNKVEIIDIAV